MDVGGCCQRLNCPCVIDLDVIELSGLKYTTVPMHSQWVFAWELERKNQHV